MVTLVFGFLTFVAAAVVLWMTHKLNLNGIDFMRIVAREEFAKIESTLEADMRAAKERK